MTPDKRFLVFGFDTYYPSGGMRDLKFSFDTAEEAISNIDKVEYSHVTIYDRVEGVIIFNDNKE